MLFEHLPPARVELEPGPGQSSGRRQTSHAGQVVTPESALSVSAVLAAFTILSEDIASLPLILYQRQGRNKNRAWNSAYYRLMHDQPNPEHTSLIYREMAVGHLLAWGNSYSQIIPTSSGDVKEIWPLRPDRMQVLRLNGQRVYLYRPANGGKLRLFFQDEILHIPAFGFDGLIGFSRLSLARNAIGLAIAAEKYGSKFYVNDARPSVVLKHPGKLSEKASINLSNSWDLMHKGVDNSHNPAILEEGMDIETIGLPPEDAQFLETRRFQVTEIARFFRVPPHMIGDVEKSTSWGTGIDSQEQGYVNHTLRPWLVRIEQELNAHLLLSTERGTYFYEHLLDGLLRGDLTTRYGAYVQAVTNGIMSPNEIRERENLNPYTGGDEYYHPLNLSPSKPTAAKTSTLTLEPLYRETLARVTRRELNDLRGAARRFLAKGQSDSFQVWVAQFYGSDQPQFVERQFAPLLEAQARLGAQNLAPSLQMYFDEYFHRRAVWLATASLEEIEREAGNPLPVADPLIERLSQAFEEAEEDDW